MMTIFAKAQGAPSGHEGHAGEFCPGGAADHLSPRAGRRAERKAVTAALSVCPRCGYHYPIGAYYRLSTVLDSGTFRELYEKLPAGDPLHFPGYGAKLAAAQRKTGLTEAVVTAVGCHRRTSGARRQ